MLLEELFFEIGVLIVIAAGLSMIAYRLRQPLIIAYIITGILAGPGVFALVRSPDLFEAMSKIGVAFLLFTVGLGLNWRNVKDVGGISLAAGVGQVLFTSIVSFVLSQMLGFDTLTSLYLSVAFTFSSTIIIIKFLMDKEELDTLYGRISVGLLLVQDFIAMFILLGLGAFGRGVAVEDVLIESLLKVLIIVPVLWFVSAKIVPPLVAYAARSQELLFMFAIGWCFLIAGVLVWLGFGVELGALIAGITLSGTIFEKEVNARVRPLRDFFLIIFFILLGTHLSPQALLAAMVPTVVFSLFILLAKPLIVLPIMRSLGYHPRTGFLTGTTMAQISEFSFIVLATGISLGHVTDEILTIATAVGLVTIAASSYMIEHNERIYERLRPLFRWLEMPKPRGAESGHSPVRPKIVMFGYHRIGPSVLEAVRRMRQPYVIVDFDPQVVRTLAAQGEPTMYGDAGDENFLDELKLDHVALVVSTIPDEVVSQDLLRYLRSVGFKGVSIVSVHTPEEAAHCYKAGATYVIVPNVLGGEKFRELLEEKKTRRRTWEALARKENGRVR